MTSDDDRIAYLAGDMHEPLDPDDQTDLDALRDLLADPAIWAEPDPSLEDRVVAAIASEAAVSDRGPAVPPMRRPSRSRVRFGVLGAAAAVAVAVAITVGVVSGASSAQRYAAALSASGEVPGASGGASLTRTVAGWRIDLRTSGLPRLDNGRYYEAWMINPAGVRVSIGTFNQGPDVTLWSGVTPVEFTTIAVTQQDINANPAGTGQRVLVGSVKPPKSS